MAGYQDGGHINYVLKNIEPPKHFICVYYGDSFPCRFMKYHEVQGLLNHPAQLFLIRVI